MSHATTATIHPDAPTTHAAADGVGSGLAVVALAATTVLVLLRAVVPPAIGFIVVLAVLAIATSRSRSRALRWMAAALVLLFVGLNAPFAIADLQHPETPGIFLATLVVVVGGLATAMLAVASALRRRLPVSRIALACAGVVAAGAIVATLAAASVPADVLQPGDVEVVASYMAYPERITVGPDAGALLVRNDDGYRHTFVLDGQLAPVEVPGSASVRIPLDLAPGEYPFHCGVPGHETMQGVLVVE